MRLTLSTQKNLLAFSGGVDSTALFFILLHNNIPFDIAIVNYNTRPQAKEEVAYALSLALQYKKQCFVKDITLKSCSNFEKNARDARYAFFEELIDEHAYETLLMGHQLNDKLEWFLMQLSKGAGLSELLGLQKLQKRENYTLMRPLLHCTKERLENYLNTHHIKYFYDQSNREQKYKRNHIRHEFSNAFLSEFESGVMRSFEFLHEDLNSLHINYAPLYTIKKLEVFKRTNDDNINIRIIDNSLKKRGYLLSYAQRKEVLKQKECVIDNHAIAISNEHIYIAPRSEKKMDKKFKELCRQRKIPKKIRAYLYEEGIELNALAIF